MFILRGSVIVLEIWALLTIRSVHGLVFRADPRSSVEKRVDTTLADGTSFQYSPAPLANGLSWQASGYVSGFGTILNRNGASITGPSANLRSID